jgi:mannose-6-phosphate isomerase
MTSGTTLQNALRPDSGLRLVRPAGPRLMRNPVRTYDWGSPSVLADLQGREPSGEPEAELWMGAHPAAPSTLVEPDGREVCLSEIVDVDPQASLGARACAASAPGCRTC